MMLLEQKRSYLLCRLSTRFELLLPLDRQAIGKREKQKITMATLLANLEIRPNTPARFGRNIRFQQWRFFLLQSCHFICCFGKQKRYILRCRRRKIARNEKLTNARFLPTYAFGSLQISGQECSLSMQTTGWNRLRRHQCVLDLLSSHLYLPSYIDSGAKVHHFAKLCGGDWTRSGDLKSWQEPLDFKPGRYLPVPTEEKKSEYIGHHWGKKKNHQKIKLILGQKYKFNRN